MRAGDIVLIELPQSDGNYKLRPALILKMLPKYNDFLVCGLSTQLNQYIKDYDEIMHEGDAYFHETGLRKTLLIRLFFLAIIQNERTSGSIGKIPSALHKELLQRLAKFIVS